MGDELRTFQIRGHHERTFLVENLVFLNFIMNSFLCTAYTKRIVQNPNLLPISSCDTVSSPRIFKDLPRDNRL